MKNFIIVLLVSSFLISCEAVDSLTKFNLEYNETVKIPATLGINLPIDILTPDIETNSESTFSINNTRKDLIEDVKLSELTLTLTSPSDGDFSFLESIQVLISADGLEEQQVAWLDEVPAEKTIQLNMSNLNLQEYIKKDAFALRISATTDEAISEEQVIDVYSKFWVDAKILGQ